MALEPKKKKNRNIGLYPCEFSGCSKVFSRHDHLLRHQRNHNPGIKIPCGWPGCTMIFSRTDIREKHYRRHSLKESTDSDEENAISAKEIQISTKDIKQLQHPDASLYVAGDLASMEPIEVSMQTPVPKSTKTPTQQASAMKDDSVGLDWTPFQKNDFIYSPMKLPDMERKKEKSTLSPSDLIEWLFHDDNIYLETEPSHHSHIEFPNGVSPMSLLESMFAVSPNFPHSKTRKSIDESLRTKLVGLIPLLELNPDFGIRQIERCLEIYWLIFHPQYPILHKPSFSNFESHPLLLLAMIMIGASLCSCTGSDERAVIHQPTKLADEIALPLRWLIFANPDCKPPAKVWVIQSLLLLETYEITSTSRFLHERAYLHHGTKIQLLRRSPTLGGDPLKDDDEEDAPPNHVWKKWVEVESMKRATLMAFYLDTVNATVYGHMIVLYAHQIKLSLPCEDDLWEFDNTSLTVDSLMNEKPPKFLVALRKLLHRQKVNTSAFGRKILLAGLLTIMFQMQQKDLQLSFLEWNQVKDSWTETISLAIDVWKADICRPGCCFTETSLRFSEAEKKHLPPMLRIDDRRCKFGLYHISQIYMRITHYDYIIFAGAPSRMNVSAGRSEYTAVVKRVSNWANSQNGRISVVHAYLFLCEMLLSPDNEDITYSYDPNADPFLHRKNIIVSAVLVVFAYNFVLEGPEDDIFDSIKSEYYPDKEDGHSYLKRIRKALSSSEQFHTLSTTNSTSFHNNIKRFAVAIVEIPNKNQMVGLLKIFYKSFKNCRWEVGREYSKLFRNCIERALGSQKITCDDMYSDNITD